MILSDDEFIMFAYETAGPPNNLNRRVQRQQHVLRRVCSLYIRINPPTLMNAADEFHNYHYEDLEDTEHKHLPNNPCHVSLHDGYEHVEPDVFQCISSQGFKTQIAIQQLAALLIHTSIVYISLHPKYPKTA